MSGKDAPGTDPGTFAGRLNRLWEASTPEGRGPYTPKEVADTVNARAGGPVITAEYIRKLRLANGSTPSVEKAGLLAAFFGVPLDYFNTAEDSTYQAVAAELDRFLAERRRASQAAPPDDVMAFARTLEAVPQERRRGLLSVFAGILNLERE